MKQITITLISAVITATSLPVFANEHANESAAGDTGLYLVPSVAYHFLDDKGNIDDLPSLGLSLGYQWDQHWALEVGVRAGTTETRFGDNADMASLQVDGLYSLQARGNWQPYALGTLMALSFDADKTRYETLTGVGAGSYYRLNESTRLRGDARVLYSYDDNLIDYAIMLGVQFTFGSKAKSATQPAKQQQVVEKPAAIVAAPAVIAAPAKIYTFEVHFETESPVLLPEYKDHVEELITVLKGNPNSRITIEGDTDNTGSDAFNLHLSAERAESVKSMLVTQYGIHEDRISIDAEGEIHPIADNATAEGRAKNRRAVVKAKIIHK